MAEQQNLVYEQINWGWLNDYAGYKFAPITFYEQLYTSDGRSFKNMFNDILDDLKDGTFVVGASQRLVQENDDGTYTPYNPGMKLSDGSPSAFNEFKPIYFLDGKPSICPYLNIDSNGNINIAHEQDENGLWQISIRKDKDEKILNDTWGNSVLPAERYNDYTIYSGYLYGDKIISRNSNETDYTYINFGNIKATNKIDVPTVNSTTVNSTTVNSTTVNSTIVNSNVNFTNPIKLKFNGDVTEITTNVTSSNNTFTTSLTLKNSGVTSGTYGQESASTLAAGGTFIIPCFTVNSKGLITAAKEYTMTLPSSASTLKITEISSITASDKYYLTAGKGVSGEQALYSSSDVYLTKEDGTTDAVLMGAAWNDYAEFRKQQETIEPGYCVTSNDRGEVSKTTIHLQSCDGIVSDTYGFAIGKTEEYQTPLAVSGRVLAYCHGERNDYHSGDVVCAGPEGKVYKMTRDEIQKYPDRIVGIVSEIPEYDTWNNKVINNRIWIKVK